MDKSVSQSDKEVVSNYMRSLAEKSHKVVKEKYGKAFYARIGKKGGQVKKKIK
jgi:hypothetical protein